MSPVERTVTLAASVGEQPEAWAFVMEHIESVGPRPRITISPITIFNAAMDDNPPEELFEVSVSGMTTGETA